MSGMISRDLADREARFRISLIDKHHFLFFLQSSYTGVVFYSGLLTRNPFIDVSREILSQTPRSAPSGPEVFCFAAYNFRISRFFSTTAMVPSRQSPAATERALCVPM